MPQVYAMAESVEEMAQDLIGKYHPELATAKIKYIFKEKAGKKGGKIVYGSVKKLSGAAEFLLESNFLVEVALDEWNVASNQKRIAVVDHLLERCYGEEEEGDASGTLKWKTREPDVHEFSTILNRHGVWNKDLEGFVSVARDLDINTIEVDEEQEVVRTTSN